LHSQKTGTDFDAIKRVVIELIENLSKQENQEEGLRDKLQKVLGGLEREIDYRNALVNAGTPSYYHAVAPPRDPSYEEQTLGIVDIPYENFSQFLKNGDLEIYAILDPSLGTEPSPFVPNPTTRLSNAFFYTPEEERVEATLPSNSVANQHRFKLTIKKMANEADKVQIKFRFEEPGQHTELIKNNLRFVILQKTTPEKPLALFHKSLLRPGENSFFDIYPIELLNEKDIQNLTTEQFGLFEVQRNSTSPDFEFSITKIAQGFTATLNYQNKQLSKSDFLFSEATALTSEQREQIKDLIRDIAKDIEEFFPKKPSEYNWPVQEAINKQPKAIDLKSKADGITTLAKELDLKSSDEEYKNAYLDLEKFFKAWRLWAKNDEDLKLNPAAIEYNEHARFLKLPKIFEVVKKDLYDSIRKEFGTETNKNKDNASLKTLTVVQYVVTPNNGTVSGLVEEMNRISESFETDNKVLFPNGNTLLRAKATPQKLSLSKLAISSSAEDTKQIIEVLCGFGGVAGKNPENENLYCLDWLFFIKNGNASVEMKEFCKRLGFEDTHFLDQNGFIEKSKSIQGPTYPQEFSCGLEGFYFAFNHQIYLWTDGVNFFDGKDFNETRSRFTDCILKPNGLYERYLSERFRKSFIVKPNN
jgi:hypothetical protein